MLTAAFLILLTLTVGPFVFGFLRGLAGRSEPTGVQAANKLAVDGCTWDYDEEYINDYWAGLLPESPTRAD